MVYLKQMTHKPSPIRISTITSIGCLGLQKLPKIIPDITDDKILHLCQDITEPDITDPDSSGSVINLQELYNAMSRNVSDNKINVGEVLLV